MLAALMGPIFPAVSTLLWGYTQEAHTGTHFTNTNAHTLTHTGTYTHANTHSYASESLQPSGNSHHRHWAQGVHPVQAGQLVGVGHDDLQHVAKLLAGSRLRGSTQGRGHGERWRGACELCTLPGLRMLSTAQRKAPYKSTLLSFDRKPNFRPWAPVGPFGHPKEGWPRLHTHMHTH